MTTLTPRGDEWKAVKASLEEDWPTIDAAAKEVVKVAYGVLAAREWSLLTVHQGGRFVACYGPYGSESEATKAAALIGDSGFTFNIVNVTGAGILNANAKGNPDLPGFCKVKGCGHAGWEHLIGERNSRGKCAREGCPCDKKFKK